MTIFLDSVMRHTMIYGCKDLIYNVSCIAIPNLKLEIEATTHGFFSFSQLILLI